MDLIGFFFLRKIGLSDDCFLSATFTDFKLFFLGNIQDPDLLIRTGGEKRLSNFIMYNLTYTEIFFIDTLWPDFRFEELKNIISEYDNIKRTYGL